MCDPFDPFDPLNMCDNNDNNDTSWDYNPADPYNVFGDDWWDDTLAEKLAKETEDDFFYDGFYFADKTSDIIEKTKKSLHDKNIFEKELKQGDRIYYSYYAHTRNGMNRKVERGTFIKYLKNRRSKIQLDSRNKTSIVKTSKLNRALNQDFYEKNK